MMNTPATIEHDGDVKGLGERVRRLQRESWPGGQGRGKEGEEIMEVEEVKEVKEVKEIGADFQTTHRTV